MREVKVREGGREGGRKGGREGGRSENLRNWERGQWKEKKEWGGVACRRDVEGFKCQQGSE